MHLLELPGSPGLGGQKECNSHKNVIYIYTHMTPADVCVCVCNGTMITAFHRLPDSCFERQTDRQTDSVSCAVLSIP